MCVFKTPLPPVISVRGGGGRERKGLGEERGVRGGGGRERDWGQRGVEEGRERLEEREGDRENPGRFQLAHSWFVVRILTGKELCVFMSITPTRVSDHLLSRGKCWCFAYL